MGDANVPLQFIGFIPNEEDENQLQFGENGVYCSLVDPEGNNHSLEVSKDVCISLGYITSELYDYYLHASQISASSTPHVSGGSHGVITPEVSGGSHGVITPEVRGGSGGVITPEVLGNSSDPQMAGQNCGSSSRQEASSAAAPKGKKGKQAPKKPKANPKGRQQVEEEDGTKEPAVRLKNGTFRHDWDDDQTRLLLHLYHDYMAAGIGPFKRFRNKKAMWERICSELNRRFILTLVPTQVETRFKNILKRKTATKAHNKKTGETREEFEHEDLIDLIKAQDDSLVAEVKRGVGVVEYSPYHHPEKVSAMAKTALDCQKVPSSSSSSSSQLESSCTKLAIRLAPSESLIVRPPPRTSVMRPSPLTPVVGPSPATPAATGSTPESLHPQQQRAQHLTRSDAPAAFFTPMRKRMSASENLLRCMESGQRMRSLERERKLQRQDEQLALKEEKENARECRKERHHQEKMSVLQTLCGVLYSSGSSSGPSQTVLNQHPPNQFTGTNGALALPGVAVNQNKVCAKFPLALPFHNSSTQQSPK